MGTAHYGALAHFYFPFVKNPTMGIHCHIYNLSQIVYLPFKEQLS